MEKAHKRGLQAESVNKPPKKRRIEQFEEYNITKVLRLKVGEGGIKFHEVCGIRNPDMAIECDMSSDDRRLVFKISRTNGITSQTQRSADSMEMKIGEGGISLYFCCKDKVLLVWYLIQGRKVSIIWKEGLFTITDQNLEQITERIDSRLPCAVSQIVNHLQIKKMEQLILTCRNRTLDVLRIFLPSLPHEIFSVIWDFAISDGVLSSKFTCGMARLLNAALENGKEHWLKSFSLVVSKVAEQLHSSEASYLLQKCSMKTVDFKPLSQFAERISLFDKQDA